jgi:hypothetical protein
VGIMQGHPIAQPIALFQQHAPDGVHGSGR